MIHIIPRNEKDGVTLFIPQQQIKEEDLEKLREAIVGRLGTQKQQKKEGKIEKPEKTEKKVEKKPKEKVKEKPKEKATKKVKQSKKEDAVGLDDIAGLFGG
jgi:uncharacterized protein YheU (UPF0270 family)